MRNVFDDPHDGSMLVAVERPPNIVRMMPDEANRYLAATRPHWIDRVVAYLDVADDEALAELKRRVKRDLFK